MASLIEYNGKRPVLGERVFIADGAKVIGDVEIGNDSSVFYNAVIRADLAEIRIGKRTNIQDNVTIHLSTDVGVHVGDNVTVGHNAILHACDVDDNVLVGMGAILMDGVHIKSNSVVAAGAIVIEDVPDNAVVAGSPARVIKMKDAKTESKTALVDALRTL